MQLILSGREWSTSHHWPLEKISCRPCIYRPHYPRADIVCRVVRWDFRKSYRCEGNGDSKAVQWDDWEFGLAIASQPDPESKPVITWQNRCFSHGNLRRNEIEHPFSFWFGVLSFQTPILKQSCHCVGAVHVWGVWEAGEDGSSGTKINRDSELALHHCYVSGKEVRKMHTSCYVVENAFINLLIWSD